MGCKKCTAKLKESARFCPECGTAVTAEATPADAPSTSESYITIRCQACGYDYPAKEGQSKPCPKCNGSESVSEKQKMSSWSKPGYGAAAFLIIFGIIFYLSNQGVRYGGEFYTNMHNIVVDGFTILIIGLGLSVAFYFRAKD